MEQVYIDWSQPFLSTVAERLISQYTHDRSLDFRKVILALPGSRSRRRLETLLVERAEELIRRNVIDSDWFPPVLITIGSLPELLYPLQHPLANALTEQFAWYSALSELIREDSQAVQRILTAEISDDLLFHLELGKLFSHLHRELASEGKNFHDVTKSVAEKGVREETERWEVLSKLQDIYLRTIDANGRWDVQTARIIALEKDEYKTDRDIFIIGVADMNQIQKKILRAVSAQIHLYIYAPESWKDHFDDYGCLIPDKWQEITFPLLEEQIVFLPNPQTQALWISNYLQSSQKKYQNQSFTWHDCIIGLPDPEVLPFLERRLLSHGIPYSTPIGKSALHNRVCLLVRLLANYLQHEKYAQLVALLRHPDLEHWIRRTLNWTDKEDWLSQFDRYQNEYLPDRADALIERKDEEKSRINFVYIKTVLSALRGLLSVFQTGKQENLFESNTNLLQNQCSEKVPVEKRESLTGDKESFKSKELEPEPKRLETILQEIPEVQNAIEAVRLPLKDWLPILSNFLCKLYEDNSYLADSALLQLNIGMEKINSCLDEMAEIPEGLAGEFTGCRVLRLLAHEIESLTIPQESVSEGVELSGWLDLFLNETPIVIISGMNEGIIPSSQSGDQFLPDSLRNALELTDNNRRFARDAYAFLSICQHQNCMKNKSVDKQTDNQAQAGGKKSDLRVLFGHHSLSNDALLPSRFLFATDEESMVRRVCRFFNSETDSVVVSPQSKSHRVENSKLSNPAPFRAPVLRMKGEPPQFMQVSEFQSFLTCPYRYFLSYQLKLGAQFDNIQELDSAMFGNVVHKILYWMGRDENARNMTDPEELSEWLSAHLQFWAKTAYGDNVAPLVSIQLEQMRQRLCAFAQWQTAWRHLGNEIKYIEIGPKEPPVLIDENLPMKIHGRIDRIDYNRKLNRWFLFDYKTMDKTKPGKEFCSQILPADVQALIPSGVKNQVDLMHRKSCLERPKKLGDRSSGLWQWTNLQLPLYRLLFEQICKEQNIPMEESVPILGYIILPKQNKVTGMTGPWMEEDFKEANETALWVIRTLRRLWKDDIDPYQFIDSEVPEWGKIMNSGLYGTSVLAPITMQGR